MKTKHFQPFVQADGSDSRAYGGTGLGLAISRQIIELMDGRIGVESTKGSGSVFWFEVELTPGALMPVARTGRKNDHVRGKRKIGSWLDKSALNGRPRYRSLLVEDNEANQEVAGILLRRLGHAVMIANNGEEGLARLAEENYDVVLMDCQMPVLDGFAARRRLRAGEVKGTDPQQPVIALTA
ncbi:MAG: response regulator [Candidatus Synoicihabitans palmerolidicus]|nr:response regulator [Candidatus Synoicihabitans palmerolidicus]